MRLIVFPLFFLLLFSSCAQRSQNAVTSTTQKVSFSISGMVCTSCEQSIQTKLVQMEGVKSVEASTAKKCATVEFDASKVSEKELIAAIESLGYKATVQTQSATN
ncbi:MAG: hypothetical protein D0433_05695 [Candidatus Thermochlorobacter aerophilum]|jgi:mercuric ion transport protein|uniref:HMA domain-containing protein n=1 Tax=Candidatus Thermochlorobacter aerophilus TaxID=1868324 RepID=A0A395M134_9BACT|nr:MAG: hypothetical protein D0433_05695 [Candidatus Thermochlorobacter aerophilum]